jgi:hypothetical protein
MNRIIPVYRLVFAAGIVSLLVGVCALSTATRSPFLRPCTRLWHTSKAGHLSESEQHLSPATEATEVAEDIGPENEAAATRDVPREEVLPTAFALIVYKHPFRSPPPVL